MQHDLVVDIVGVFEHTFHSALGNDPNLVSIWHGEFVWVFWNAKRLRCHSAHWKEEPWRIVFPLLLNSDCGRCAESNRCTGRKLSVIDLQSIVSITGRHFRSHRGMLIICTNIREDLVKPSYIALLE